MERGGDHSFAARRRRSRLARVAVTVAAVLVVAPQVGALQPSVAGDWTSYLGGPSHDSVAVDRGIARSQINALALRWRWKPPSLSGRSHWIFATPATWKGTIYVGGDNGVLYALDETNAAVRWKHDFGVQPMLHCHDAQGIVGSPAVRADSQGRPFVYVNAPDGYLYELNGSTGATVWRSVVKIPSSTVNDTLPWSSPTVFNGKVYVGIASNCDSPFVRGAVRSYNALTGKPIATAYTIPNGYLGAGVWTSVAVDSSGAYVTTGSVSTDTQNSNPPTVANDFDQYSIVKFNPDTFARTGKWVAPTTTTYDPDFASSPILFDAVVNGKSTHIVGGCRKDGNFYAVRTDTMQLVWQRNVMVGTPTGQQNCLGGGVWDGARLFLSGGATTIGGVDYAGSVRRVNPATGAIIWERGLPAVPLGAGSYNRNGILAYATADYSSPSGDGVFLLDPATGKVLRTLHDSIQSPEFAQPIWADGQLFQADMSAVVNWRP